MFIGNILIWPPWWDWILFIPSITALLVVLTIGGRSRLRQDNRHQWFTGLLNYQVVTMWLGVAILVFWSAPSRDGMNYILIMIIMVIVAASSFARLAYLYVTDK